MVLAVQTTSTSATEADIDGHDNVSGLTTMASKGRWTDDGFWTSQKKRQLKHKVLYDGF